MNNQFQLETIVSLLEAQLREGNFDYVDKWMDHVDVESLADVSILGVLTITFWGKDKLSRRDAFLQRAEIILKQRLGEERAEKLLVRRR